MQSENSVPLEAQDLSTPYEKVALYLEDADAIEYVRRDAPAVYERVDEFLTLIVDMKNPDDLVGFSLKGFRNFYNRFLKDKTEVDFVSLMAVISGQLTIHGDAMTERLRAEAYARAFKLAVEDGVKLQDLPKAA